MSDSAREPSLEEKLTILWDERQITDVLHRYCRGFDRRDMEMAKGAFWADALDDHPGFCGLAHEMCEHFDAYHRERWASWQHHITNTRIDIDGDTAHAESYCFVMATELESLDPVVVGGRYIRRLERRGGEWRIAASVLVANWSLDPDTAREMIETGTSGAQDASDPSYERPLQVTRTWTTDAPRPYSSTG
jgi:hypothetical protein